MNTEIFPVRSTIIHGTPTPSTHHTVESLEDWTLTLDEATPDAQNLHRAAHELRTSTVPVAFPTETVYGLGADATRSEAVRGIYAAKARPSDNPLIVHIHSLRQLRRLLQPKTVGSKHANGSSECKDDPIPSIYHTLIQRFWPGPLTIILPNPHPSHLALEVTANLPTFGARMPGNALALALLKLADVPVAAPSANSSSKPSPTTAAHVAHDLDGRIASIVDGGPCEVGVESTVVSGLCSPPVILRPGGVGIEELRMCEGWEGVVVGYKDGNGGEEGGEEQRPLAPGMKYKHYSPRARVVLYEFGMDRPERGRLAGTKVGVVKTVRWSSIRSDGVDKREAREIVAGDDVRVCVTGAVNFARPAEGEAIEVEVWEVDLGRTAKGIARGLFAALRELDLLGVDVIHVEGIDDRDGEVAAAVMNRLRKAAAEVVVKE